MSGPARLSLSTRLLVLLITVTATFLFVMGGVTTLVLSRRLTGQFQAELWASAQRRPPALTSNPDGDLAVAISVPPWAAALVAPRWAAALPGPGRAYRRTVLLTPGRLGTEFERLLGRMTWAQFRQDRGQPFPLVLADGTRLWALEQVVPAHREGLTALPWGPALLVVARPVSMLDGQLHEVVIAELITGAGLLLLLALGGRWLIGRGLAPLNEMAGTAQRVTAQGDLTARMPDAGDSTEVGRLGAAINTMLDRIQQAFGARLRSEQKVRQFAADASHELRTPLTTIRGYAELYRQGALGPDQLPDAMRRIEQEARRMSTLVAELLELARLDRTSSLDLAETDLAALVRDAVADAHAVEPERRVRAEAPARLVALVDEARIRQVLANLLGNVREHTPAGTPATVRLDRADGGVVLEVADAGPGMAPDDAARAFDRFHRGRDRASGADAAPGAGDSGGSGLGLSIVQAIAQAHGGEAVLESGPGQGTRVKIWLPASTS